jgi:hypothetical protein
MSLLGLSHRPTFQQNYLNPAIEAELIERTIPDKPKSPKQRYRLKKNVNIFNRKFTPFLRHSKNIIY